MWIAINESRRLACGVPETRQPPAEQETTATSSWCNASLGDSLQTPPCRRALLSISYKSIPSFSRRLWEPVRVVGNDVSARQVVGRQLVAAELGQSIVRARSRADRTFFLDKKILKGNLSPPLLELLVRHVAEPSSPPLLGRGDEPIASAYEEEPRATNETLPVLDKRHSRSSPSALCCLLPNTST